MPEHEHTDSSGATPHGHVRLAGRPRSNRLVSWSMRIVRRCRSERQVQVTCLMGQIERPGEAAIVAATRAREDAGLSLRQLYFRTCRASPEAASMAAREATIGSRVLPQPMFFGTCRASAEAASMTASARYGSVP